MAAGTTGPVTPDWHPRPAPGLPDALVLFDGVCVMCAGWVAFIIRHDLEGRYRFVPIQSALGAVLAARFGVNASAPESNVVIREGTAWFKSDAALRVGRDLPGWRWLALFRPIPRPLRNAVYDLVARHRYPLFGRRGDCPVPPAGLRARFLTEPGDIG